MTQETMGLWDGSGISHSKVKALKAMLNLVMTCFCAVSTAYFNQRQYTRCSDMCAYGIIGCIFVVFFVHDFYVFCMLAFYCAALVV